MSGRRRWSAEQGFTLVELLVVLVILGVVGGMVTTAVVSSLRSATSTTSRVIALDELQTAMQRMSRDLRAAELFVIEVDTDPKSEVNVVIFRDGVVQDVSYKVVEQGETEVLVREDTGQTLITLVDNQADPVFTYLDSSGDAIDCPSDCGDAYSKVRQIQIRLVRGIEDRAPVIVESLVNVRNTRYRGSTL